ncbi:MAG TPA: hypothetical protein VF173_16905 [Thermoanaerobaculia bacterium]|nr:hypothetical protein [Thermoanaerobaculia bacterium]
MAVFDGPTTVEQELTGSSPEMARPEGAAAAPEWGMVKRLLFRFGLSYLFLYLLPSFLGLLAYIPGGETVSGWYEALWLALVPWVGRHVFGVAALSHPTGSGDTMFGWVEAFCFLVVALVAALVWTLVDRKRKSYPRLYEWLRIWVRFGLGMAMMQYGCFKLIPSQFPRPSLDRMMQSLGDSSPMGILWTFMGASAPYTIFTGLVEWIGGALLLFRRTAGVGALLSIAAMTNVVILNFCYDVPVKLYSFHLLAMAVFLAAPDLRRLTLLLVLRRPVQPEEDHPLFRRRWLQRGGAVLATVFLLASTVYTLNISYNQFRTFSNHAPAPLYGIWEVDELIIDGQARPLVLTDESRWRRVVLDYSNSFSILLMNNFRQRYFTTVNPAKKTVALTKRGDPAWKSNFAYQQPAPGRLTLEGTFDGKKVHASLHRIEAPRFRLITRGFHWVSEYPYNE